MKSRQVLAYLILVVTVVSIIYIGASALSQAAGSTDKEVLVEVNQLPLENGIVPVEISCDNVKVVGGAIERLSCILKNNSAKPVTAAGIRVTVILERDGKKHEDSGLLTFDSLWQSPSDKTKSLIPPVGQYRLEDTPSDYGSAIIDKLEIHLDYVEFADENSIGPNSGTSRIIADSRTGAAKYRDWLSKQLDKTGGSVEARLPMLEGYQGLPKDLGAEGSNQEDGAQKYRSYIRRIYMTKGSAGVRKQLQQERRNK